MTTVFLETSALLRMLFREPGSHIAVGSLKTASRVISSRLIQVEAERALIRLSLDPRIKSNSISELERELRLLWPKIDFIEITREICELAGRIAPKSRLRALDAIHLATYYRVRGLEPSIRILSFDDRIRSEAPGEVLPP